MVLMLVAWMDRRLEVCSAGKTDAPMAVHSAVSSAGQKAVLKVVMLVVWKETSIAEYWAGQKAVC